MLFDHLSRTVSFMNIFLNITFPTVSSIHLLNLQHEMLKIFHLFNLNSDFIKLYFTHI